MEFLNGLKNFLTFINDNWTSITIIIALIIGLVIKIKNYFSKSNEEKIEIAKKQISQIILKLITDAEEDYAEWTKAGEIKRSQVINKIFEDFPILLKATNQEEVIKYIDETIDEQLKTLRDIISKNEDTEKT